MISHDRRTARLLSMSILGLVFTVAAAVAMIVWLRTHSVPLTIASVGVCSLVFIVVGLAGVVILGGAEGLALVRGKRPGQAGNDHHPGE